MKGTNRYPQQIEAVEWTGEASLANRLFGERYGVDWKYEKLDEDVLVMGVCGLPRYKGTDEGWILVKKGDWVGRDQTAPMPKVYLIGTRLFFEELYDFAVEKDVREATPVMEVSR